MRVLVIDGQRNGLGVARALAGSGLQVEVHVASAGGANPAGWSRATAGSWSVPSPADPRGWVDAMLELGDRLRDRDGWPILLPVDDIYVMLGARFWPELRHRFRSAFETRPDSLDRCLAKDRCYDLATACGVAVPRWGRGADAYLSSGGGWPAIVKPAIRNAPEMLANPPFRARICGNAVEVASACAELLTVGARPTVQEFIPGGDDSLITVGVAALEGRILALFTGRKLRQFPPAVGQASYAVSCEAPEAAAGAARMLADIGFTGLAQVEYKRSGGVDHLLEINPRSWSWIGLAPASGVNLPAALAAAVQGLPGPPVRERYGVTWMFAGPDLRYHGRRRGVAGWFRWLREAAVADVHAHWRWNDPAPALAFYWQAVLRRRPVR